MNSDICVLGWWEVLRQHWTMEWTRARRMIKAIKYWYQVQIELIAVVPIVEIANRSTTAGWKQLNDWELLGIELISRAKARSVCRVAYISTEINSQVVFLDYLQFSWMNQWTWPPMEILRFSSNTFMKSLWRRISSSAVPQEGARFLWEKRPTAKEPCTDGAPFIWRMNSNPTALGSKSGTSNGHIELSELPAFRHWLLRTWRIKTDELRTWQAARKIAFPRDFLYVWFVPMIFYVYC